MRRRALAQPSFPARPGWSPLALKGPMAVVRFRSGSFTIPCGRTRLAYRGRCLVMGILNVTPDSFSDGGAYHDLKAAVARGVRMAEEGADILDIGGESTRPSAHGVPLDIELDRVIPVIRRLAKAVRIPLSVDTSKAEVAHQALEAGASIVNDVTALRGDPGMIGVVARHEAGVILMHMRGDPRTMQHRPRYRNVTDDVAAFLLQRAAHAQASGIARSRILLDPGLGFGKTPAHNLRLLRTLAQLVALGFPVVIGPSRKSFIGALLNAAIPDRLGGTLACAVQAERCGACMVRVHDVQATVQLLRMLELFSAGTRKAAALRVPPGPRVPPQDLGSNPAGCHAPRR